MSTKTAVFVLLLASAPLSAAGSRPDVRNVPAATVPQEPESSSNLLREAVGLFGGLFVMRRRRAVFQRG